MKTLEELRARQREIVERLTKLNDEIGDNEPTDEQRAEWDKLEAESRDNERDIKPLAEAEERQRVERERRAALVADFRKDYAGKGIQVAPSIDKSGDDIDLRYADRKAIVSRAQKVLDDEEVTGHLNDSQKRHVQKLVKFVHEELDGVSVGRSLIATSHEDYLSAFQKYTRGQAQLWTQEEIRAVQRAMAVGANGTGGYAVPIVIDPTVILTGQESPNDVLRLARVEQITTGTWRGLTTAGMNWEFTAEAAQVNDTSPTIAQPSVPTYRADGFIPYSIEVDMDWPGFAGNMTTLLGEGYSELLANKLTNGTGTGEPTGIVTAVAASGNTIQVATSATLVAADIYGLWAALPIKYRARTRTAWMSSVSVENTLRGFGSTGLDPNFTVNLTQEGIPRLFGREYPTNDYMPAKATGVSTAAQLLLGDFQNYLVAQRLGMTVEYVPQVFGPNGRPTGQRGMVAWARIGANVINAAGFRMLINK